MIEITEWKTLYMHDACEEKNISILMRNYLNCNLFTLGKFILSIRSSIVQY